MKTLTNLHSSKHCFIISYYFKIRVLRNPALSAARLLLTALWRVALSKMIYVLFYTIGHFSPPPPLFHPNIPISVYQLKLTIYYPFLLVRLLWTYTIPFLVGNRGPFCAVRSFYHGPIKWSMIVLTITARTPRDAAVLAEHFKCQSQKIPMYWYDRTSC